MKEAFELIRKRIVKLYGETPPIAIINPRIEDVKESNAYLKCLEIVREVEAEYGNGWIPCSERLPEEPKENPFFEGKPLELYLVSMKHAKYPWRAFWNGKDFTDGWSIVQPEAWMPLPEPYKPEK